jgi:hypothetical protein
MTDHHPALQYAHYQLKDKTGIPAHLFQVNEEYLQAANKIIPKPSFQRDSELVSQYSDWNRQKQEIEAQRRSYTKLSSNESDGPILQGQSSGAALSSLVGTESIPSPPVGGIQRSITAEDQFTSQELAVSEMMRETNESKDVCIFYLESTNWDLASAVDLLRSMQVR